MNEVSDSERSELIINYEWWSALCHLLSALLTIKKYKKRAEALSLYLHIFGDFVHFIKFTIDEAVYFLVCFSYCLR